MAFLGEFPWLNFYVAFAALMLQAIFVNADDIYLEWQVNIDTTIKPVLIDQPVFTTGLFVFYFFFQLFK